MRFSSLTVIALLTSESSAFTVPGVIQNTFIKNAGVPIHRRDGVILQMADEKPSSKKEEKLKSIQESLAAAEAKRLALEAELAAAEAARLQLELEAEKAAAAPEPLDLPSITSGPVPLVTGAVVAAAGARSALQNRGQVQDEKKKQEAIKKAAAEQDARNRAAAAAKSGGGSNVSFKILRDVVDRCSDRTSVR